MGGLAGALDMGAEAISKLSRSELFASMEHVVSQTEAGKFYAKTLKNVAEPAIDKNLADLTQKWHAAPAGMKPYELREIPGMARSAVKNQIFGKGNVNMMPLLQAVEQQGGKIAAEHLADAHNVYWREAAQEGSSWRQRAVNKTGVDISTNTAYTPVKKTDAFFSEKGLKNFSRSVNLAFITIPHAAQPILNGVVTNGWINTMKALGEVIKDGPTAKAVAMRNVAMGQEMLYEAMATENKAGAKLPTRIWKTIANPLGELGIFNAERRFGIVVSAVGGKHAAIEAAEKFFASGGTDKEFELQLKALGQEPANVMKQGGILTTSDMERAAYRSADRVMGMRSPLETPLGWEKNAAARLMTTYKPYGFRSLRLHTQVLHDAMRSGGWAKVSGLIGAYTLAFPVAGELIRGVMNAATLRNPLEPTEDQKKAYFMGNRYIDDIGMAMGLHTIYAITRAATFNKLTNFAAGPIFSTVSDLTQDAIQIAMSSSTARRTASQNRMTHVKQLTKDVLRQTGAPGRIINAHAFKSKKPKEKQTW